MDGERCVLSGCRLSGGRLPWGVMGFYDEIERLEEEGIELVEVLGGGRSLRSPADLERILERLGGSSGDLHCELLRHLTGRRFAPEKASALWHAASECKRRLDEALGRAVSFRVAMLDVLCESGETRRPRLLGGAEYSALAGQRIRDETTGAFTREYLNDALVDEVHRARRYGGSTSLLVLDLDDFSTLVDRARTAAGDAFLSLLARQLRRDTRRSDRVCRYAGDAFALLLPETDPDGAATLVARLLRLVRETPVADHPGLRVTTSIGGASYPDDCDEAEELVALADQKCLAAKSAGKDRAELSRGDLDFPFAAEG